MINIKPVPRQFKPIDDELPTSPLKQPIVLPIYDLLQKPSQKQVSNVNLLSALDALKSILKICSSMINLQRPFKSINDYLPMPSPSLLKQ